MTPAARAFDRRSLLLLFVSARTLLLLVGQGITAAILALRGEPEPFLKAGAWWTVFGTFADLGCVALIAYYLRDQSLSFRQLLGRFRGGKDLLAGLGIYLAVFPIYLISYFLASRVAYGTWNPELPAGILHQRVLPFWAVLYSVSAWWLLWSPTEELTYQRVLLPSLSARFGPALGMTFVWFWWTLQHAFLPLVPDWRYVIWRFLAFAGGVLATLLIYRKVQRIQPMIVAHYPMDIVVAFTTIAFSAGR